MSNRVGIIKPLVTKRLHAVATALFRASWHTPEELYPHQLSAHCIGKFEPFAMPYLNVTNRRLGLRSGHVSKERRPSMEPGGDLDRSASTLTKPKLQPRIGSKALGPLCSSFRYPSFILSPFAVFLSSRLDRYSHPHPQLLKLPYCYSLLLTWV